MRNPLRRYILLLFVLLFSAFSLKAQDKLIAVLKTGSAKKLNSFFMKGHRRHDCTIKGCVKTLQYREILPQSKYQNVFGVLLIPGDYGAFRIYLEAVVDDKTIVAWRVYNENFHSPDTSRHEFSVEEIREGTIEETIDSSINKAAYASFNKDFKAFYGIDVDMGVLLSRLDFGPCGYEAWLIPQYKAIMDILQEKDIPSFSKWLRSGNVELQLYAMLGFKRSNVQLSPESRQITEFLLSMDFPMYDCDGCSFSMSTFQAIARKEGFFELIEK